MLNRTIVETIPQVHARDNALISLASRLVAPSCCKQRSSTSTSSKPGLEPKVNFVAVQWNEFSSENRDR